MNSPSKVVMALSGGLDSSTMLVHLINLGYDVECVNFVYGSHHNKYEVECAKKIAKHYNTPYKLFDLTSAFSGFKSNLLSDNKKEIPEGHYEEESMSKTVVPGRNSIFSMVLMGYAESIGAGKIALGVHQGDHAIYPDCRLEYIKALDTLVYLASDKKVEVIAPFIDIDKNQICKRGSELGVPFEYTRTCYKDQELSCGKCGSCTERLEAFKLNNLVDPIKYDTKDKQFQTEEGIEAGIEVLIFKLNDPKENANFDIILEQMNELNDRRKQLHAQQN